MACWRGPLALCLLALSLSARAEVTHTLPLIPGTPDEAAAVLNPIRSSVDQGARRAEAGGGWTYRLVVPPEARCTLTFTAEGSSAVRVEGADGKPIPSRVERGGDSRTVYVTAPVKHPLGGALRFQFRAVGGPLVVRDVRLTLRLPDRNNDRLSDTVERLMGLTPKQRADVTPRPDRPRTSFQTGSRYHPAIGVPTDAVLVYSSDPANYRSWADKGYVLQTMGGFRDGPEYVTQHPGEVQTDRNGNPLVIGGNSYYMVPTRARLEIAKAFYAAAIEAGSTAVCPEEPEIWSRAGYSEAFKQEWQARYSAPWEPPHGSVDARYKSEQLKAFLTRRQIETILNDVQQRKPAVTRMVAIHSPVTYYHWGIPVPHYALLSIPALQEIIGQVWTGTARTAARAAGVRAERTFEVGYLEYSSLYHLARGTGKRMWFLMDPVEDTPNLPIEDYHRNYEQTLLAALMFPEIDSFEVMPWPDRIYQRVPGDYMMLVNTVVGALCEMWRYPGGAVEAGSEGIGTFVADSMGWQRADPAPSDYDGFYGLTLPLVLHGIPVQVLSLDRAAEPGYLDKVKTLLVSYDFLKPMDPALNRALADWTRRGGSLVVFGGSDAYNAVADSWWRKSGFASPVEDLFARMGLPLRDAQTISGQADDAATYKAVLTGDGTERNLRNRKAYTLDLTPFAQQNGSVSVRFEDVSKQDGWGPYLVSAELRIGGQIAASFLAGSEMETRFLVEERDSKFNGTARFADGEGYWVYRFNNLPQGNVPITLTLDMGNGFLVKARPSPPPGPLLEAVDRVSEPLGRRVAQLRVPRAYPLTLYAPPPGATSLYRIKDDAQYRTPPVWEAPVGQGTVTFVGVAPGYLSATAQSAAWLRALAGRAYEKAGGLYREQPYFLARRGPYTAIRTLARKQMVPGRFVNLLDANLPVVEDPEVPAHGLAFLMEVGPSKGAPRVVAVSGRLRARSEQPRATSFLAQGPARTDGAARLWKGGRQVKGVKAFTVFGAPLAASVRVEGDTLLVRYPNDPDGVVVRVVWN